MTGEPFRLGPAYAPRFGRLLDRTRRFGFRLDGRRREGFAGDTLASALLANGTRVLGRSPRFHRPRGIVALGDSEPSLRYFVDPAGAAPECLAPGEIELRPGLELQSAVPSMLAQLDRLALADRHPVFRLDAAFERAADFVRRSLGRVGPAGGPAVAADAVRHDCDLLIVGGGLAGLAALEVAAAEGLTVVLAEVAPQLGGIADLYDGRIDGRLLTDAVEDWAAAARSREGTTVLTRTRAVVIDPSGQAILVEHSGSGERVHRVAARSVILATGARERPLVFGNNDRPGVMLSTPVRALLRRRAVLPGRVAVVVTATDEGYRTAFDLHEAGAAVQRIVDLRLSPQGAVVDMAKARGLSIAFGSMVVDVRTRRGGRETVGVSIENRFPVRNVAHANALDCDLVVVSGGWDGAVELAAGLGTRVALDPSTGLFRIEACPADIRFAGAAAGVLDAEDVVRDGIAAGEWAVGRVQGETTLRRALPEVAVTRESAPELVGLAVGLDRARRRRAFADIGADVTVADFFATGRRAESRVARLGGGADHGRLSRVTTMLAREAADPAAAGHTEPGPLDMPGGQIDLAALAALGFGAEQRPRRRAPLHPRAEAAGALMARTGEWTVAAVFPLAGESRETAVRRGAAVTRATAGLLDASHEGRMVLVGASAADVARRLVSLGGELEPGGVCRLTVLGDRGAVLDRGIAAMPAPDRVLLVCGWETGQRLLARASELAADTEVQVVPLGEPLANLMLLGPAASAVLADATGRTEPWSAGVREVTIGETPVTALAGRDVELPSVRLLVQAGRAAALGQVLTRALEAHGGAWIGVEVLERLRLEAGEAGTGDLSGWTLTPADLGLEPRAADADPQDRPELVGIVPTSPQAVFEAGAVLVEPPETDPPRRQIGALTSVGYSPVRGSLVGLALVLGGRSRHGEEVLTYRREAAVPVRIVPAGSFGTRSAGPAASEDASAGSGERAGLAASEPAMAAPAAPEDGTAAADPVPVAAGTPPGPEVPAALETAEAPARAEIPEPAQADPEPEPRA